MTHHHVQYLLKPWWTSMTHVEKCSLRREDTGKVNPDALLEVIGGLEICSETSADISRRPFCHKAAHTSALRGSEPLFATLRREQKFNSPHIVPTSSVFITIHNGGCESVSCPPSTKRLISLVY